MPNVATASKARIIQPREVELALPLEPHDGQQLLVDHWFGINGQTEKREIYANCHVGWGKTLIAQAVNMLTGMQLYIDRIAKLKAGTLEGIYSPLVNQWVVAPSHKLLKQPWAEAKKFMFKEFKFVPNETEKELRAFPYIDPQSKKTEYHWYIRFRAADDPGKLVSENIDTCLIEEAREVSEEVKNMIDARLTRAGRLGKLMVVGTPGSEDDSHDPEKKHWLFTEYQNAISGDYDEVAAFKFSVDDPLCNPYLERWKVERARKKMDPTTFRREYLAEFTVRHDMPPVIEGFNAAAQFKAVRDRYNPAKALYHLWDFGWRRPAFSEWQEDADDRILTLVARLGENTDLRPFAKECLKFDKAHFPDAQIILVGGDQAGHQKKDVGRTSIDELELIYKEMGYGNVKVQSVPNTEVQHEAAIAILQERCRLRHDGTPGWLVDTSCSILERGLSGGWRGDERRSYSSGRPKPKKDGYYDHLGDTCLHFAMNFLDMSGHSKPESDSEYQCAYVDRDEIYGADG